ncbi:Flp family type IVb pilin [Nocardioides sp. R1-1]|uniref:Flp family type IVb pilin n=1 Tax=Nocardioides sp. R1-1 TaxID=3383502 RepID=UPI0038D1CEB7
MSTTADITPRGASAVEYGLIVAMIAGVIVFAVLWFGRDVMWLFENTNASIDTAVSP